jgi:flagellar biogenesis protein FliO
MMPLSRNVHSAAAVPSEQHEAIVNHNTRAYFIVLFFILSIVIFVIFCFLRLEKEFVEDWKEMKQNEIKWRSQRESLAR